MFLRFSSGGSLNFCLLSFLHVIFPNHALCIKALTFIEFLTYKFAVSILASEDFFDKLTVEQEFMSGIDTDKVCENETDLTNN